MAYAANDDELRVLPYNRVIKKSPVSWGKFLDKAGADFTVRPGESTPARHEICVFGEGEWAKLVPKDIPNGAAKSLDVSILQDRILAPILGIADPRGNPNIFFVGGADGLERYATEMGNSLVFSLYPTSVGEVEKVADAGGVMPPKSTWFDPKLLSGLFVRPL